MKLPIEPIKDESSDSDEIEHDGPSFDASTKETLLHKCEVKEYEERFNLKGEKVLKEVEAKVEADAKVEGQNYAMQSYKYYSRDGTLESSRLEIQSPYIKEALRDVVKEYPSVSFRGDVIILHGQLRCIFHYRNELEEYRQKLDDGIAKLHIHLILRFMEKELRESIRGYKANVETSVSNPSIEFKDLWMVFLPGEPVMTGQYEMNQILTLISATLVPLSSGGSIWRIAGRYFTHDGRHFGYSHKYVDIYGYEGTKRVQKLPILPLRYYDDEPVLERIRKQHIARGRKFCSLKGNHYRSYNGIAYAMGNKLEIADCAPNCPPLPPGTPYFSYKPETVTINSRIMVDTKTFGVIKSPNRVWLNDRKSICTKSKDDDINSISSEDLMISDFQIPGFSLFDKKWCLFAVDFIQDVEFNEMAFQQLLLPETNKQLVHALVKNHGSDDFDDLIKGKGKGLVFVLHGQPGVGKTFTAESIADDVRKPLYIVNSGELGVTPYDVENNLNSALKLATHWGAVVLIDEADVFLEQRTIHDLTRNCLVSLFLRTLEYYEGILFLTTNRLTSFDLAFRSRIHLALKYSALNHQSRKDLWKIFLERTSKTVLNTWDESVLDDLAKVEINGRQIKNTVRTANTLAKSMNVGLQKEHLHSVLETLNEFETALNEDTQDSVRLRD